MDILVVCLEGHLVNGCQEKFNDEKELGKFK